MVSLFITLMAMFAGKPQQMSENVLIDAKYEYETFGGTVLNDADCNKMNNIWTAPQHNVYDYCLLKDSQYYDVVFTLDEKKTIYATEISVIHIPSWGIIMPSRYEIYASDDATDYKLIYSEDIDEPAAGGHKVTLRAETSGFSTSHLKFRLYRRHGNMCMDEIRAFSYSKDGHIHEGRSTDETCDMYDNSSISHFLKMDYWKTRKNTPSKQVMRMLSDGNRDEYATFYAGGGRHIIWDLKKDKTIEGFKAHFLSDPANGTYIPPVLCISVSEDAQTWYTVQAEATGKFLPDYPEMDKYGVHLNTSPREEWDYSTSFSPVKTRYVRLSFETNRVYVRSDEVKISEAGPVFSAKGIKGTTVKADADIPYGHYPTYEQTGFRNMFYADLGFPMDADAKNQLTYAQAKKMFPTFDAVCFTSFRGNLNVDQYCEFLLGHDFNCGAIERVLDEHQQSTGEIKSVGLWFAAAHIRTAKEDFETFVKAFNAQGYRHLHILGLYWVDEGPCYEAQEDLKDLNAFVHSKGYRSFWCPYYGQSSMWHWVDWGFDFACVQPNSMFHGHASESLNMTCEIAKILGMSVELEIDSPEIDSACEEYRKYLKVLSEKGADKTCQIFYLGSSPNALLTAEDSGLPFAQTLYQDTLDYLNR